MCNLRDPGRLADSRRLPAKAYLDAVQPMKKFARTMRTHRELVLNYFRARKQFSSGVIEGLNNKRSAFT